MLILASNSPRRKEILKDNGFEFVVVASDVEEIIDNSLSPEEVVMSLSKQKATDICRKYPNDLVLGFDTIVVLDNKIYPKPKDFEEAKVFLKSFSNKEHQVITGCTICSKGKIISFYEKSYVSFLELTKEDIIEYLNKNEWQDKAGGYAIQGNSKKIIKGYRGSYANIVGLPIELLKEKLENI